MSKIRILRNYTQLGVNYFQKPVKWKINDFPKVSFSNGSSSVACFTGKKDMHNSLVIESQLNCCQDLSEFKSKLDVSLKDWEDARLKAVWFKVSVPHVEWIPILKENGFKIHRCSEDKIYLYRWFPKNEACKIPHYAHTMVGAGAAVINKNNQILVVRETFRKYQVWKLPGGYVDKGEDIGQAAIREVLEETGIKTEFVSLLGFRYVPVSIFGCSDLYFIVRLAPLTHEITKQPDEIEECSWMDVDEFLNKKEVYDVLRNFVRQAIQNEKEGIAMECTPALHPITKTPQLIFNLNKSPPRR